VLIWYAAGDSQLSDTARGIVDDFSQERLISIASIWEMGIKSNIGKLAFKPDFESFIQNEFQLVGYDLLPIELPHIFQMEKLPLHHRDPFDRIIIAQSLAENIPVVTKDSIFGSYGAERIW
jgi:PIN domain nuclease of toxin-antitoxin system